jgi:hypothetical protein
VFVDFEAESYRCSTRVIDASRILLDAALRLRIAADLGEELIARKAAFEVLQGLDQMADVRRKKESQRKQKNDQMFFVVE